MNMVAIWPRRLDEPRAHHRAGAFGEWFLMGTLLHCPYKVRDEKENGLRALVWRTSHDAVSIRLRLIQANPV
jgi:hypothetical protein